MRRLQTWLSGLLAAQLLLAAALYFAYNNGDQRAANAPLLGIEAQNIDRLVINGEDSEVELARNDGDGWRLPVNDDLPAETQAVADLLRKLSDARAGWPVATTESSHERFEVAADKFQRRIRLYKGGEPAAELFIGTSPGFRKVHVRRAGDDAVYTAELNAYDIHTGADGWLDKSLLTASGANRITGPDYTLISAGDGWQLAEPGTDTLDQEQAQALADALEKLRVSGIAEADATAEDVETVKLTVETDAGELEYVFSGGDDARSVTRSDVKGRFRLSRFDYDRIAGIARADLLVADTEAENDADVGAETPE